MKDLCFNADTCTSMKEIGLVKDTFANKVIYYHLLAFLLFLPFDRLYSELVLISLTAQTLILLPGKKKPRLMPALFLPAALYILTVLGSLYSEDKKQALTDCEKQLALILFPLIFSLISIDIEKYKTRLLKGFGLICTLLVLYLFYDAVRTIRYNHLPISEILNTPFTNHNFSLPLGLHATYFSMFIALSLASYLYIGIHSPDRSTKVWCGIVCLILFAGLLQLASRSVFLATLIILNAAIPYFLLRGKTKRKYILISLFLSGSVIALFAISGSFKSRYLIRLRQDLTVKGVPQNLSESRMRRWYYMGELIRQRPLAGHGSGTEVKLLKKNYFDHKLYNSYLHELNADNQYISFLLKQGILGLLVYLAILFTGFRYSIRAKDFLFCSFLIIIAVVSFSENILDVNKGIFFFGFFFPFFINARPRQLCSSPLTGIGQHS
jgi:hypothetical protein